jgi:hypothetical protein
MEPYRILLADDQLFGKDEENQDEMPGHTLSEGERWPRSCRIGERVITRSCHPDIHKAQWPLPGD